MPQRKRRSKKQKKPAAAGGEARPSALPATSAGGGRQKRKHIEESGDEIDTNKQITEVKKQKTPAQQILPEVAVGVCHCCCLLVVQVKPPSQISAHLQHMEPF